MVFFLQKKQRERERNGKTQVEEQEQDTLISFVPPFE
jgi:hypothetical protein